MRMFRDTENNDIYTLEELERSYEELVASGDTEAESFGAYLSNCLEGNGFLQEIR